MSLPWPSEPRQLDGSRRGCLDRLAHGRFTPLERRCAPRRTLLAVLLLLCAGGDAEAQRYRVSLYTEIEGLPSSSVLDLAQDGRGLLWTLTRGGLSVYDGVRWKSYAAPWVTRRSPSFLEIDEAGWVWTLGSGGGLEIACLDPSLEKGGWRTPPSPPLNGPASSATAFELGPEGQIFVGTSEQGLWIWDGESWSSLSRAEGLVSDRVLALESDGGRLYVATGGGLCLLTAASLSCPPAWSSALPAPTILALDLEEGRSPSGTVSRLWILGQRWLGQIESGQLQVFADGVAMPGGRAPSVSSPLLPSGARYVLAADGRGGVVYGDAAELFHLSAHRVPEVVPLGEASGLPAGGATGVLLDREKNLWVASRRGLAKISDLRFESYDQAHGLLDDGVTALLELEPGRLVFGHEGGLTLWREGGAQQLRFSSPGGGRVMDLAVDSGGRLWIAAHGRGLGVLAPGEALRWHSPEAGISSPVRAVLVEESGDLWLGTDRGLLRMEGGRFKPAATGGVAVSKVQRLISAPSGALFVATAEGLVFRAGGRWRLAGGPSPASRNVFSVLEQESGRTWVGTGAGLFNLEEGVLQRALLGGEPVSSPVFSLLEDRGRRLWIGTDRGTLRWNGERLERFTSRQGLAGNETHLGASLVDAAGDVWIGTEGGVSRYREANEVVAEAPLVELLGVDVGDRRLALDQPLQLRHDDNDLTFAFRGVSLVDEKGVRFRAQLEGFDPDWIAELAAGELRYTNLPPGAYRFRVQAANVNGVESPAVSSASIVVAKPYWQRGWFFLLAGLLLIGVGLALGRLAASQRRVARSDFVTGLPNRAHFVDRLEGALERSSRRPDRLCAVLVLDLDRFKNVNDSLGHLLGDELLRELARRLVASVRSRDTVARFGGDEFAILLEDLSDLDEAVAVAERMRAAVAAPFDLKGYEVFISASIGIAPNRLGYERYEEILRDADTAMYRAKDLGSGGYVVFDPEMHATAVEVFRLENELRRAVESSGFHLHYLPIVDLASGRLVGLEALLRWSHPERGLLLPGQFLSLSEEAGLGVAIGEWVVGATCRQLRQWEQSYGCATELSISVNLSHRHFLMPSFSDRLVELLEELDVPPERLEFEVSESTLMERPEAVLGVVLGLQELNVRISIDDFGSGHASLSYLQRFGVKTVKIDRGIVARLAGDGQSVEIVRAILGLGHNLGFRVLAEGIETQEQLARLDELGCDLGQGYYFSQPLPTDSVASLLAQVDRQESPLWG